MITMKKLTILLFVAVFLSSSYAKATDAIKGEKTIVIHNYKSTPIKILGREGSGGLCSWNEGKQKWICTARDTISTGETVILWNKPGANDGYAFLMREKKLSDRRMPAWLNEGWNEDIVAIKAGNKVMMLNGTEFFPKPGNDIVVTDIGISHLGIQEANVHPNKLPQRDVYHY